MGRILDFIDQRAAEFIRNQRMFFVGSAPLASGGKVNVSPKGLDTFRVVTANEVAYLDFNGSGAETIAHVRENGRITFMFCAFEGPPRILRVYGEAEVLEPDHDDFASLRDLFESDTPARSIIRARVTRVAESCGFGVPLYSVEGDRTQLREWADRKGAEGLVSYQREKNAVSIDGLPALRSAEEQN